MSGQLQTEKKKSLTFLAKLFHPNVFSVIPFYKQRVTLWPTDQLPPKLQIDGLAIKRSEQVRAVAQLTESNFTPDRMNRRVNVLEASWDFRVVTILEHSVNNITNKHV